MTHSAVFFVRAELLNGTHASMSAMTSAPASARHRRTAHRLQTDDFRAQKLYPFRAAGRHRSAPVKLKVPYLFLYRFPLPGRESSGMVWGVSQFEILANRMSVVSLGTDGWSDEAATSSGRHMRLQRKL